QPITTYPLFENAFRAARGLGLAAHRRELADFAARSAALAARNPYAWFRDGKSAGQLGTVTPDNRMVGFPYPKFMNAILDVNQGAALILASEATARRLGLPADRWAYPWATVDGTGHGCFKDRVDYPTLPGTPHAAATLAGRAGGPVLQAAGDALPHPAIAGEANGAGTIETYTIVHGRDGAPERAPVIGRLDDGRRFLATIAADADLLAALEREELVGRRGR